MEEDREEIMNYIASIKNTLYYSRFIDSRGYDNICDVLDVLVNTVEDNMKEV